MNDRKSSSSNTKNLQNTSVGKVDEAIAPLTPINAFEANLQLALEGNDLGTARSVVADAEAVLVAHGRATNVEASKGALSKSHLAGAKARIAMSAGDPNAARAILVQAIERWPDVLTLRAMMTEVMLATGRAKDVRSVLTHLGRQERSAISTRSSGKKDFAG